MAPAVVTAVPEVMFTAVLWSASAAPSCHGSRRSHSGAWDWARAAPPPTHGRGSTRRTPAPSAGAAPIFLGNLGTRVRRSLVGTSTLAQGAADTQRRPEVGELCLEGPGSRFRWEASSADRGSTISNTIDKKLGLWRLSQNAHRRRC